ncbi:Serine/threonine-protein kinase PknB [Lacipirellula limnantheis]|uniref:non-specific serine/threonine protein kinase n=2 Tax=Lacipirellula limnantheis TaxID=2528024 RepID=A0A517TYM9_9BACT|nr:Serine/threonine-protein kinase PknB [Lacipirellula limnantheis]
MDQTRRCPNCGAHLSTDALGGLCPTCLLREGMAETIAPNSPPTFAGSNPKVHYFGDYEVESQVARGGMGVVYKARQLTLNRPVALKMILAGHLADDVAIDRFYAEAEAVANLKHPNIVAIHEVGLHEGQHYFSMDYIDGPSLAEWAARRPTPALQAATLVKTIAEAVHFAHSRGTLHRDLKPSNILIDADNVPHVTDFGLAKTTGSGRNLTQTGDIMGTPAYMSPEQASGRHDQIGPHSDVYALGAIFYELLTGEPPFQSDNPMAALLKVMEAEPIAPRTRNSAIPPDLETICLKCLEKSPQRRYHSARDLAEDLDRFIRREPIHARPASVARKAASWMRGHPGILAAATAFTVAALVAGLLYLAEENAFLRAQQANPALAREPGTRNEALGPWQRRGLLLCLPGFIVAIWIVRRSQRWRHYPSGADRWVQPAQPLIRLVRVATALLGLAATFVSVMILLKSIEALVWEGEPRVVDILIAAYPPGWVGLWLLALVVQDYRLTTFGDSAHPALTKERKDAVESKLLQFGRIPAIQLYREIYPSAGLAEAKAYVDELESLWRQRDPQGYAAARPPWDLNWRLMAVCGGIETAVLIFSWPMFQASLSRCLGFTEGFLLGLFFAALPRLRADRKRLTTLLFAVAAMLFLFAFLQEHVGDSAGSWNGSYLLGILFGAALLTTGYSPIRFHRRDH